MKSVYPGIFPLVKMNKIGVSCVEKNFQTEIIVLAEQKFETSIGSFCQYLKILLCKNFPETIFLSKDYNLKLHMVFAILI